MPLSPEHQRSLEQQQLAHNWEMPPIEVGAVVTFYPYAVNNHQKTIGFVAMVRTTGRGVTIRTAQGNVFTGVRHIDDPKLQVGPEHRENGAWDYSESDIKWREKLDYLQQQIDALKGLVVAMEQQSTSSRKKAPVKQE